MCLQGPGWLSPLPKEERESGIWLAEVTCLLHGNCDTCGPGLPGRFSPKHPGRRSSEAPRLSFVCGLFFFFPREKSNSEAVFQVLSLFCQCQGDLLCHIT